VERVFAAYMFHQHVPHWVRHFARRVIRDSEAGHLDPERLGVARYPRQRPLAELGEGYITTIYVAAVIICVIVSA
jgi:hypothetical protein